MRVTHSFTDESATIRIEGLAAPVRMLQLTDTHVHFYDERDGEKGEACAHQTPRGAFQGRGHVLRAGRLSARFDEKAGRRGSNAYPWQTSSR